MIVAYSDNASVMEGSSVQRFVAKSDDASRAPSYQKESALSHVLMKVETHNHSHGHFHLSPVPPPVPAAKSATKAQPVAAPNQGGV